MRITRNILKIGLVAVLLCGTTVASALPGFDQERFKPSPHPFDVLSLRTTYIPKGYQPGGALYLNYSNSPFGVAYVQRNPEKVLQSQDVVDHKFTFDLAISMALWDRLDIGLSLPIIAANSGESGPLMNTTGMASYGVGDLRIAPKVTILSLEDFPVGLGFELEMTAPTGMDKGFFKESGVMLTPRIILDVDILKKALFVFNLGYRWRTAGTVDLKTSPTFGGQTFLTMGNELYFGFAAQGWVWKENLGLFGEFEMFTKDDNFFGLASIPENNRYFEGRIGARYLTDYGLGTVLAFSMSHDGGASLPESWRLIAGISYCNRKVAPKDRDGDGVVDESDRCPDVPEDIDSFEDQDGCPDPDNDNDGIADKADMCPNAAEDQDGFEDQDGCSDPDNDNDGVLDMADGCPNHAEDIDQFQDSDGCPDPDNDNDGISDVTDKCPLEAETKNGCQDADGCPESGKVCMGETKLVIADKVFFKTGKAEILEQSFPLLREVATVLKANPQVKKLRIEGHTDNVGKPKKNLTLSRKRAESVLKFLVKEGIDKNRLTWEGYGQTKPIDTNDTEDGRGRNRRVEFFIVEQEAKPVPANP